MKKKLLFILLISFSLTGCWNYRELNHLAIVGAIGIDYDEENELFELSVQVFNAKKSSSNGQSGEGGQSPITVYTNKAKTLHEALRNTIHSSPKKPYIGHLDIVVLGESFAKKGFMKASDFLLRDDESRKVFNVMVTKDAKASDVLKVLTSAITLPAVDILDNIVNNSLYKASVVPTTFDNFILSYYTSGIEPTIPVVMIDGDNLEEGENTNEAKRSNPKTELRIDRMSIFKDDKLIGYLDDQESVGYALVIGKIENTVISFKCDDDNYGAIEINKYNTKIKGILKDDKPMIEIDVSAKGLISEYNCNTDLKKPDAIEKIEYIASKTIKSRINDTITVAQKKFKSDVFGFGNVFQRSNYTYWKKIRKKWYDIFPNLEYIIKINLQLPNKGSTVTSVKGGKEFGR